MNTPLDHKEEARSLSARARRWLHGGVSSLDDIEQAVRGLAWMLYLRNVGELSCSEELKWFLFASGLPHAFAAHQHEAYLYGCVRDTVEQIYTRPLQAALSEPEVELLLRQTDALDGTERYRQLQFMFALVQLFKTILAREFDMHCRRLADLPGANSMTYSRRLNAAAEAKLVAISRDRHRFRGSRCRTLTLLPEVAEQHGPTYTSLDDALVAREDLTFLSHYMQNQVRARARAPGETTVEPVHPKKPMLALWAAQSCR